MRQVHTTTRTTEVLCMAAREASNLYEPWDKRVTAGRPINLENSLDRVPSRYLSLMRESAKRVNPKGDDIISLFSPEAYALLCKTSSSPFWFWRIVSQAAESARTVPLQVSDIEAAVKEVSYRWHIGCPLGQKLMTRSFAPNLQMIGSAELTGLHREGYVVAKHGATFDATVPATMEINPLFLSR